MKLSSIFVSFYIQKFDISQNNVIFQTEPNTFQKQMKNKIKLVVAVFTAFLTSSCGHLAQKADPQGYSQAITNTGVKPLHIGSPASRRDGVYYVQTYHRSVVFMATTGLIRPSQVEVFDLDHNGSFDVVYLQQSGVWSIGFTRQFSSQNKVIADTLSSKVTREWVERANKVKRASVHTNRTQRPRTQLTTAQTPTPAPKPNIPTPKKPSTESSSTTSGVQEEAPKAVWWSPYP